MTEKYVEGVWEAVDQDDRIVVRKYEFRDGVFRGKYVYHFKKMQVGDIRGITSCIDHYYVDMEGEKFSYDERNYEYKSYRHYFRSTPDYEKAEEIAKKMAGIE